jgi:hypothetical protein
MKSKWSKMVLVVLVIQMAASAELSRLTDVVASEDTWVGYFNASEDHGDSTYLIFGEDGYYEAYLKFDLSGITIPAGQQVAYVALRMTSVAGRPEATILVHEANSDSWGEGMLWAGRVGYQPTVLDSVGVAYQIYPDVTSAVQTCLAGDKILSLVIFETSGCYPNYYASSEHSESAARPTLEVYTEPVPEPATLGLLALGGFLFRRRK